MQAATAIDSKDILAFKRFRLVGYFENIGSWYMTVSELVLICKQGRLMPGKMDGAYLPFESKILKIYFIRISRKVLTGWYKPQRIVIL